MEKKLINRKQYKAVKKMDRQEMETFIAKIYLQGYEDGAEDAEVTDFKIKLMQVLERTKGVGPKTTEKILQTLKEMQGKTKLRGRYNGIEELKKLEDKEKRIIVEVIPFKTFKEKIAITKQFYGKAKMEIHKGYVYIERAI